MQISEHERAVIIGETGSGNTNLVGCWAEVAMILPYPKDNRQCKVKITYVPKDVGYPKGNLGKELWVNEKSLEALPHNARHPEQDEMDPQSPA